MKLQVHYLLKSSSATLSQVSLSTTITTYTGTCTFSWRIRLFNYCHFQQWLSLALWLNVDSCLFSSSQWSVVFYSHNVRKTVLLMVLLFTNIEYIFNQPQICSRLCILKQTYCYEIKNYFNKWIIYYLYLYLNICFQVQTLDVW